MSLALGAFLAGILLADSDHHSQAAAEVEPFRDAFASLFFVSIGMLFDWQAIAHAPGIVVACLLAVVAGKATIVMLAAWRLGQPFWVRLRAALTLAQVGEFSFVLVQLGKKSQILPELAERVFVVVAVLSIASTPMLYALGNRLARRARARDEQTRVREDHHLKAHAIVIGYGPTGRAVVGGLRALGIPVVVSEMNAATVKAERVNGIPIQLGDATRVAVLKSLGIERAKLCVVAVNDSAATARIAQLARQFGPQTHVLARAVYNAEAEGLRQAGVHEVVPQELEASIEMLVRVLRRFLVPDDEIGRQVRDMRKAAGPGDRASIVVPNDVTRIAEFVPGINFAVWRVAQGSPCAGQTLQQAAVRRHTGCSVVAVRRSGHNLPAVTPETVLEIDDTVVVLGPQARLPDAAAMFVQPAVSPRKDDA